MSALDVEITEAERVQARALGACNVVDQCRTWSDAVNYPGWLLRYAAAALPTPEVLKECARREPWDALKFAAALLTPELLAECARCEPWAALKFAAALLTPEVLAECARCEPSYVTPEVLA